MKICQIPIDNRENQSNILALLGNAACKSFSDYSIAVDVHHEANGFNNELIRGLFTEDNEYYIKTIATTIKDDVIDVTVFGNNPYTVMFNRIIPIDDKRELSLMTLALVSETPEKRMFLIMAWHQAKKGVLPANMDGRMDRFYSWCAHRIDSKPQAVIIDFGCKEEEGKEYTWGPINKYLQRVSITPYDADHKKMEYDITFDSNSQIVITT